MSSTTTIHAGYAPAAPHFPVAVPVHQTTAYEFPSYADARRMFALTKPGFTYSRTGNPTVAVLEQRVAELEGGTAAVALASGQSAVALALLALLGRGDAERDGTDLTGENTTGAYPAGAYPTGTGHDGGPRTIVAARQLYGGTLDLLTDTFADFGYRVEFVDHQDLDAWRSAITPRTRAVLLESITNPLAELADVPAIAEIAHAAGVPVVVDNTLATPVLYRPLEHGADIVVHSATKFLGGHGTALAGVVVDGGRFDFAADPAKWQQLAAPKARYAAGSGAGASLVERYPSCPFAALVRSKYLHDLGPALAPDAAASILRSIETLELRIARHGANARSVAAHLAEHPAVARVHHPAVLAGTDPESTTARIAARDYPRGAGSVFAFDLAVDPDRNPDAVGRFIDALGLFKLVANLGDTRSLVAHPAAMTHCRMTREQRAAAGIAETTIRVSIGLEEPEDLVADLDQALLTVVGTDIDSVGAATAAGAGARTLDSQEGRVAS